MIQSWRTHLAGLAMLLAVAALSVLAAGPLGWRMGWWHYGYAFQTLLPWAAYAGMAAAVISALAVIAGLAGGTRRATVISAVALMAAAIAIYMPWQANGMRGAHPRTNDISTDLANAPAFAASLAGRTAEGRSDTSFTAEAATEQKKSYADIAPLTTSLPRSEAFKRAAETATSMPGWRIIASDASAGRIEASHPSRWFGFVDDVVIRVTSDGEGSRIDIRSASRQGRGDFGVNAARVRGYLAALAVRMK